MPIKIEFQHGRFNDIFTMPRADVERDFTSVNVTCDAGLFMAEVVRDSRDQPNRRIARMKALERPSPRSPAPNGSRYGMPTITEPTISPQQCSFCGEFMRTVFYDWGHDPDTGYHDHGCRLECPSCGAVEERWDES